MHVKEQETNTPERENKKVFCVYMCVCVCVLIIQGWGVRTAEWIRRGEFVCEYVGEVVDPRINLKRYLKY